MQARGLTAELAKAGTHRLDNQVIFVTWQLLRALARHLDAEPTVGDPGGHFVVEAKCQTEAVEAGAQVSRTGRYSNPNSAVCVLDPGHRHASPASRATAVTSPSTTISDR